MFFTVPTCQTFRIYYWKTKQTTWTLHTSGFPIEIKYPTPLCKLRVDDFKVWFVVLGLKKKTNLQARRHNLLILRMRISQTLPNSKHSFGHCLSMNVFKMHRTVCNQHWTDISTSSVIIRRMRTRQGSRLSLVKIKLTISHFWLSITTLIGRI